MINSFPTDGCKILHTLLVKYYNDLLGIQSSERGRDEVTYFYVGDVFDIYLGPMYADFQEKSLRRFLGETSKLFIVVTFTNQILAYLRLCTL